MRTAWTRSRVTRESIVWLTKQCFNRNRNHHCRCQISPWRATTSAHLWLQFLRSTSHASPVQASEHGWREWHTVGSAPWTSSAYGDDPQVRSSPWAQHLQLHRPRIIYTAYKHLWYVAELPHGVDDSTLCSAPSHSLAPLPLQSGHDRYDIILSAWYEF